MTTARFMFCYRPHFETLSARLCSAGGEANLLRLVPIDDFSALDGADHVTFIMPEGAEVPESLMASLRAHPDTVIMEGKLNKGSIRLRVTHSSYREHHDSGANSQTSH